MRLGNFRNYDFGQYGDFEIEDLAFFRTMMSRMVEDTEVILGVLAKYANQDHVTEGLVMDAMHLVDPETTEHIGDFPEAVILNPNLVHDFARPPIPHDDQANRLISKWMNFRLVHMLQTAAARAQEEGLTKVKLRHILPLCEEWPWPFNRWC